MNQQFRKFLTTIAANEKQKHQIPRLKVMGRQRRGLGNYNYNYNYYNSIRSGSSLLSNPINDAIPPLSDS